MDATYVGETVQAHRRAIADFRSDAKTSQDPQLKAFAAKYLPVLEDHLQLADAPELEEACSALIY